MDIREGGTRVTESFIVTFIVIFSFSVLGILNSKAEKEVTRRAREKQQVFGKKR